MKRLGYIIAAGLLCTFSSCQKGSEGNACNAGPRTVGFCTGEAATRTVMNPDGLSSSWENGDRIAVWAKNSAGEYTLNNIPFSVYGADGARAFFTATIEAPMPEDRYTYFAAYPVPESVSGTKATFTIPSVQDGRAGGGADIMIATSVLHCPLEEVKELSDYTRLGLRMEHLLHQFRFYVPENCGLEDGDAVTKIILSMPRDIVGKITADFTSPDAAPTLSDGGKSLTAELSEPVAVSSDSRKYACVSVFPNETPYGGADNMEVVVYGKTKKYDAESISLSGRSFLSGHSTPVRLKLSNPLEYYKVTFSTGMDYIGEPLTKITISEGDNVLYTHENTTGEYDNLKFEAEYLGTAGASEYEKLCSSILEGTAKLVFETESALVEKTLTAANIKKNGNMASVELGDVPYLLYEDFSRATDSSKSDSYSPGWNSDMDTDGVLLDSVMPESGWNGARYNIFGGECIRLNVRYQVAVGKFKGRYCGRLDTPSMSYLKPGVSVSLQIDFDSAYMIPEGYNVNDVDKEVAYLTIGTHTQEQSSAINSDTQSKIEDMCSVVYESGRHKNEDVMKMSHSSVIVPGCGQTTRFVFFPCTDRHDDKMAANCCYYVYLDNIKVQIAK